MSRVRRISKAQVHLVGRVSFYVVLTEELREIGAKNGDWLKVTLENGRIVLRKLPTKLPKKRRTRRKTVAKPLVTEAPVPPQPLGETPQ